MPLILTSPTCTSSSVIPTAKLWNQYARDNARYGSHPPLRTVALKSLQIGQVLKYCFCERCRGQLQQNQRTINDHRRRYPRQTGSPEVGANEEVPVPAEVSLVGDPPTRSSSPIQLPPASPINSLPHSPTSSPGEPITQDNLFDDRFERSPSPPGPDLPLQLPGRPRRPRVTVEEIEDEDAPLIVAPEVQREYRFDQLLQRIDEEDGDLRFPGPRVEDDSDDNENPEDELDDEDFGLPDGEDAPAAPLPQFQFPIEEELDPDDDPDNDPENNPRADHYFAHFEEPDLIRHAYIDAFIQKTVYGATHRALKHQLRTSRRTLSSHPDINAEDLSKMAQTIGTAERRLGINIDEIITVFTLCPKCKRRYDPGYILDTENDNCLNAGCNSTLFATRKLASGRQRRVSHLTYPFASPIAWLQLVLSLPGRAELMQSWRQNEDDRAERTEPVSGDEWMRNMDHNKSMGDLCDGWGWRATESGLERRIHPVNGDVSDECGLPGGRHLRLVSLPYGISLSLNTDW